MWYNRFMQVVPTQGERTMREMLGSVSPKGQVTLPVEVRRQLGLKPKDKVVFELLDGEVKIAPARFTLESLVGSVAPATRTEDFERINQEVKEEHAEKGARELQQQ